MKNCLFDLDDTLYFLFDPFEKAYHAVFSYDLDVPKLCIDMRRHSDEKVAEVDKGTVSDEDMHIYRISEAFKDQGISISRKQALDFQESYAYQQTHLILPSKTAEMLDALNGKKILITNGPYRHQLNKIRALGLFKWFDPDDIFISGKVGYTKPDIRIFEYVLKSENISKEDCIYTGDTAKADIFSSHEAGIENVWFNHAHHIEEGIPADHIVYSMEELKDLLLSF